MLGEEMLFSSGHEALKGVLGEGLGILALPGLSISLRVEHDADFRMCGWVELLVHGILERSAEAWTGIIG